MARSTRRVRSPTTRPRLRVSAIRQGYTGGMRRIVIGLVFLTGLATAAPARAAVPTWDREFIQNTAEGAHFEIDMGRIAARHAQTAEGRAVARLMVRDHSGELHAVQRLASSLGVDVPLHPSVLQRHEISDVAAHSGTGFDRAYARLEVGDHVMDVESADGEMTEGGAPAVKAFAAKYRTVYLRHLAAFRKFASDVHAG
jgi:putative membrane protein